MDIGEAGGMQTFDPNKKNPRKWMANEDIREGIAERIFKGYQRNSKVMELPYTEWCEITGATRGMILAITDICLEYLHSQGVVKKVDRELPEDFVGVSYLSGKGGIIKSVWVDEEKLKDAGYVAVEPLI